MKFYHRLILVFVFMCIGVSVMNQYMGEYWKSFWQDKLSISITYYKIEAKNYYNQMMGITPPPIVARRAREWRDFSIFCDSILLDSNKSVELFTLYIDCLDKVKTGPKTMVQINGRDRNDWFRFHRINMENAIKLFKKQAVKHLPSTELQQADVLTSHMFVIPDAELRALRMIDLSPQQRDKLLPVSTQLVQSLHRQHPDFEESPDDQMYEQAKEEFLSKTRQVLSQSQMGMWEEKCVEMNEKIKISHPPRRRPPMHT